MEKNTARPLAIGLTVLGALARLAPHPPNFAPVGSMSLFAGARLRGWQAYLLPLVLMAITDPLVGGYSITTPFVYVSFLISVWIGRRLVSSESVLRIGGACVLNSTLFFLITNIGSWVGFYPRTLAGLAECYAAAIPFYGMTVLGGLFYTGILFGLHAWLSRVAYPAERVAVGA
jgi:hypothetical protein